MVFAKYLNLLDAKKDMREKLYSGLFLTQQCFLDVRNIVNDSCFRHSRKLTLRYMFAPAHTFWKFVI